jgi:hypothetical protein
MFAPAYMGGKRWAQPYNRFPPFAPQKIEHVPKEKSVWVNLALLRCSALRLRELCPELADCARHLFYRGVAKAQDQTLASMLA